MSLVIAFTGREGAVMAGDLREILMQGSDEGIYGFEQELYSGQIMTDSDLRKRAGDLGIILRVRDNKCKVSDQEGILIGEVAESQGDQVRKRRLYAVCGAYAIIDIEGDDYILRQKGQGCTFVVLGNKITKQIAHGMIRSEWNNGTYPDAIRLIVRIMNTAASYTASVSNAFTILQTRKKADRDLMDIVNKKV